MSGFYPIEYRDFFIGDQYNSLIYSLENVPLFFCLYANDWNLNTITLCNSSHSRVLGFFSTLPPIWRFLQCIRRCADTRHGFPHLVNAGKYATTVLMYMTLSLWRLDDTMTNRTLFIICASVNTLYCCNFPENQTNPSVVGYIRGLVINATSQSKSFSSIQFRLHKSISINIQKRN